MSFHNARTPGELIERVDGDVTALSNLLSALIIRVLSHLLLTAGVLIALYLVDWRVGLGLTAFAAGALLILNRMRGFATPQMVAAEQAGAELAGLLEERLWGTEDVRSAGATAYTMRRLYGAMRNAWQRPQQAGDGAQADP